MSVEGLQMCRSLFHLQILPALGRHSAAHRRTDFYARLHGKSLLEELGSEMHEKWRYTCASKDGVQASLVLMRVLETSMQFAQRTMTQIALLSPMQAMWFVVHNREILPFE